MWPFPMIRWLALLLLIASCASGCSRGDAGPVPAATTTSATTTTAASAPAQVTVRPLVVQAEISPAAQALIQQLAPTTTTAVPTTGPKPSTIQLTLQGAEAIEASNVALRVFLGNPDAGAETPVTDPSFIGTINFFPVGEKEPTDYTLHLTPALKRLAVAKKLDVSKPLTFTLVPVPVRGGEKGVPPGTKIGVSKVQVSVPQQAAP